MQIFLNAETKNFKSSQYTITVLKNGEDVYLRTYYDGGRDLVQWLKVFNEYTIGDNKVFNFWRTYLIPNTNENSDASNLLNNSTIIHYCSDDSCPMNFNGTYIGANHGSFDMRIVTSSNHGKSIEDIGSEWFDNDTRKWYILRIVDDSTLWLLSENIGFGDEWDFDTTIEGNLQHSQNALHTDSIIVESYATGSLEPAIKNQIKKLYLDDDFEVVDDGLYLSKEVKIEEYYQIVDPASALESIKLNVGSTVQPELNDGEPNVSLDIKYKFDRFGGCRINYSVFLDKTIDVGCISGIQSGVINKGNYSELYEYIPGSLPYTSGSEDWDFRTLRDFSYSPQTIIDLSNEYWEDRYNPPYRFIQYLGSSQSDLDVSFIQSFLVHKGDSQPHLRSNLTTQAIVIAPTRKSYPFVINPIAGDLVSGASFNIHAYRGYVNPKKYSKNASSVFIYEEDDELFIMCDYHKIALNDTIILPEEYNNMHINVIDKNDDLELLTDAVDEYKIILNSNSDYSYINMMLNHHTTPELLNPLDSMVITDQRPDFEWTEVNLSTFYDIIVDNNSDFSSPEVNDTTSFKNYSPHFDLPFGSYFWKVRARSNSGTSAFTEPQTFTIGVPTPPELTAPVSDLIIAYLTPEFEWIEQNSVTYWNIVVDDNEDFSSPVINDSTFVNSYTSYYNLPVGKYFWKVRGMNVLGMGSFSTEKSFLIADTLFLRLPDKIYTTTSSKYSIYYNNVILTQIPEAYDYYVDCPVGHSDSMKYNLNYLPQGNYDLTLQIKDKIGNILESKDCEVIVTDNSINEPDTLKFLLVGNSWTYAGRYERFCKELLDNSGSKVKFLGTQHNLVKDSLDGLFHEGRGGWKWSTFTRYELSPFVYSDYPGVDVQKYVDSCLFGEKPDIILLFLGLSDLLSVYTSSLEEIDDGIDDIFAQQNMGLLVDKFQEVFPNEPIGIVLTPPGNERECSWYEVAGDSTSMWEWKKKGHRLVERYIDHFKEDLSKPNFSIVPTNSNFDTFNGYDEMVPQHPNFYGYEQIAHSIYGWIKYQISKWVTEPYNVNIEHNTNLNTLSWSPVNGAYSYNIFRSTDPYSGFEEIGTSTVPSYIDSDISGSDKYFYKVTAVSLISGEK